MELKFGYAPKVFTNDMSALFQVMVWCRLGNALTNDDKIVWLL